MLFVNWAWNFFFFGQMCKTNASSIAETGKKGRQGSGYIQRLQQRGSSPHGVSLQLDKNLSGYTHLLGVDRCALAKAPQTACTQTRLLSATTKAVSPAPAPASLQDSWVSAWQKDAGVNPSSPRRWYTCKVRSVMDRLWQLLNVLESVILSLLRGRHVCSDKQRPCAVSVRVRRETLAVHFKRRTLLFFFPHSRTDKE